MSTTMPDALAAAWLERASAAEADLNAAAHAPALFQPEFVEQRAVDHTEALRWARFWHSQQVTS